jgi:hypothetical protein
MIHPKAKASSECKGREAKNRRQTNKEALAFGWIICSLSPLVRLGIPIQVSASWS